MGIVDTPIEERVGNCEMKEKPIGISPNLTKGKDVSWADVVRGKEIRGEKDDFTKNEIVKSKCED